MQMVLSAETNADIRRYMTAVAAYLAYEHRCEIEDVFAAIEPLRADAPGAQTVPLAPAQASPAGSDPVAIPAFLHPQPSEAGLPEATASGSHSPETATQSTGASQERAQTATGLGAGGDHLGPTSRPTATAKTDVPSDQSQASGGGQSQDNSGVRVAPVDHYSLDTADLDPTRTLLANCIECRARIYEGDAHSVIGPNEEFHCADCAPTITENAPDPAQAGEPPTSPAPNQEPAPPPPSAVPASELSSDNAGEAIPPVSPATKLTLFQRVSAAHAEHPDWTARQIAALIKRPVASVQTTLAVVRKAAAAPEPPQQPEPPPTSAAEPRFYVLDQDGRYVHRRLTPTHTGSVVSMTDDRAMAWTPTEAQFGEAARRWPVLKSMRWRAVEKEAAR